MSDGKTYSEKLKDPRWQKRRLKVLEYAHWRCQGCGSKTETLHCHHSYYTKGKEPWQYPDGAIIALCENCHEKLHPKRKIAAAESPPEDLQKWLQTPVAPASAQNRFAAMKKMLEIP